MKKKRIAFIHYPRSVDAKLGTMPFAIYIVKALDIAGWDIDLFLWEDDLSVYSNYFSDNVNITRLKSCDNHRLIKGDKFYWINYINDPFIRLEVKKLPDYEIVFGLGQLGIYIASLVARSCKSHYFYINDEFPSSYITSSFKSYWNRKERLAASKASLIIVPDEQRLVPLLKELKIDKSNVNFAVIPNAIELTGDIKNINWHERLNLPANAVPFLHAGSVSDWAQVPEILSSLNYWSSDAVLILNSRVPVPESYKQQLSHLMIENKVFWNENPLHEDELNSLVSYCHGSFALYRDLGDNIKYIGWSSGKLLRSIVCGRPVIASNFPSLSFVEKYKIGRLIKNPSEIPEAVDDLIRNSEEYGNNCKKYADTEIKFEIWWGDACRKVKKITGIELSN